MTAAEIRDAEYLHGQRGYKIVIKMSCSVRARRIHIVGPDDLRTVSAGLLYCGPAGETPEKLHPEHDRCTYTAVFSPFPERPDETIAWGLFRDDDGSLWMDHYVHIYLKDPGLFRDGLKLELEIPDIEAQKKPVITVFCNGEKIHEERLENGGRYSRVWDIREVSRDLTVYMREARRQQFILLDELERICRKYSIPYFLICGGLIGALRDGNMIPWDDDLDLAFTRENYEKLARAVKEEWKLGSVFLWVAPEDYGKDTFYDFMTRIVYLKEYLSEDAFGRLGEESRKEIHNRALIDIYILENAPESRILHKVLTKKLELLYVLALGHRNVFSIEDHNEYSPLKKRLIRVLLAAGKRIRLSGLLQRYRKTAGRYRNRESAYCYMSNGYFRCFSLRFRKEWFGKGRRIPVGDRSVSVPEKAEDYLRTMYGDYRQYPPAGSRHPMHGSTFSEF